MQPYSQRTDFNAFSSAVGAKSSAIFLIPTFTSLDDTRFRMALGVQKWTPSVENQGEVSSSSWEETYRGKTHPAHPSPNPTPGGEEGGAKRGSGLPESPRADAERSQKMWGSFVTCEVHDSYGWPGVVRGLA